MKANKRVLIVSIGMTFLFALLVFAFFKIQIADGKKWEEIAKKQHFFIVKEPFRRGTIWSTPTPRPNHPDKPLSFVFDIEKFHLYADPLSIPQANRIPIAGALMELLQASPEKGALLRAQLELKSRSRRIAVWLDREAMDKISGWWGGYAKKNKIARNALYFVSDYQRSYPCGKLLGPVLHTVQSFRDASTMEATPTGGLEMYFDACLRGKQGKRLLKRSPRHAFETGQVLCAPEDGADIYLTINPALQGIAEEELEKGVRNCKAKGGWAVMMDPRTGEVLVLAQYPFFYPEKYNDYFNDPGLMANTRVKAFMDAHEPGSAVKAVTAVIAFLANEEFEKRGEPPLFDPEEKISCAQGNFSGRAKELKDITRYAYLNLNMGLQKSSNVYFARLAERIVSRLGNAWYRRALQDIFGFGVKTHLELPSENVGMLPTPGKLHTNGTLEWSKATPYSLAIGHNLQANGVQMARAFSVFANGGYMVQPTLVKKVVKRQKDGGEIVLLNHSSAEPMHSFRKVLDEKIVARVIEGIKYSTKPGGSGRRAEVWGYTEAGKTGTASKIVNGTYSKERYVSSFVGFTPVKNAAFVLFVAMDEPDPGYIPGVGFNYLGGVCAAPVFREIAQRSLQYLGVPPDDPFGYPPGDPRYDKDRADWLPECRKLQEIYEKWNIPK